MWDAYATMHVIEGCAGNAEVMSKGKCTSLIPSSLSPHLSLTPSLDPLKDFTVKRNASTGYGILEIHNKSHLTYKHYLSDSGVVFDSFTYDKSDNRPFKLDNETMVSVLDFKTFVAGILIITALLCCFATFGSLQEQSNKSDSFGKRSIKVDYEETEEDENQDALQNAKIKTYNS